MRIRTACLLAAVILTVTHSTAWSTTITTLFASNNGGNFGGAVYFNVTTGSNPLRITDFETNTFESGIAVSGFKVYTKPGTAQGFETSIGDWTLQTNASIEPKGVNNPSPVVLGTPFTLGANSLFGIALVMPATVAHDYTNGSGCSGYGTGGNCEFSNADLTLNLGTATNVPFSGIVNNPRTWNGTISYDVLSAPEPATLALIAIGLGAAGFTRRRKPVA